MFLHDQAEAPVARLVLAHGAGAPMDHPWMAAMCEQLVARDISTVRFEFGFMAARRDGGKARPAPRAEKLIPEYQAVIEALASDLEDDLPLFIGGKSMGGRVASMIADELHVVGRVQGLICVGYPFHPVGKPHNLRTTHLAELACPALIAQGTRDALGSREEVANYDLDARIEMLWLEDGDHDLKPRKRSGETLEGHLAATAEAVSRFARS